MELIYIMEHPDAGLAQQLDAHAASCTSVEARGNAGSSSHHPRAAREGGGWFSGSPATAAAAANLEEYNIAAASRKRTRDMRALSGEYCSLPH